MAAGENTDIALGLPGQIDGRPTLQSDRADETQQQFSYQCIAGLAFLCGALARTNDYVSVWIEHHDDLLAECSNGQFDAIQSKTSTSSRGRWKCTDQPFIDAVRNFCKLEVDRGRSIRNFIFYSNLKPKIPGPTTRRPASLAESPVQLSHECRLRRTVRVVVAPYQTALASLAQAAGAELVVLFRVMRKLAFVKGPHLEALGDQLPSYVAQVPECEKLNMARLREISRSLYDRLHSASTLDASLLALHTSPLAEDGRELAAIATKRVTAEEARAILMRHPGENFLYDSNGLVKLGHITSQKEVLRRKMEAGGIGKFFTSMWLQAVVAENRLMEEVHIDAGQAMKKLGHLESAILVECQNAEVAAFLEPESTRGVKIYQRILERTGEMASRDAGHVLNERPEILRGMAGLLSGSCHFAWGASLPEEGGVQSGL